MCGPLAGRLIAPRHPQHDRRGLPAGGSFVYERSGYSAPAARRVNAPAVRPTRAAPTVTEILRPPRCKSSLRQAPDKPAEHLTCRSGLTCRPGMPAIREALERLSRMTEQTKPAHATIGAPLVPRQAFPLLMARD